jgi:multiple sugar transport system ATP-binding protein
VASVNIRAVRKAFGTTSIIHGVDISISDGEFVVLVGPSGCGKSTLLRMIAGLENITAGEISIGNRVVNNLPPKERDVAMVFQNYALYPHMTVATNMAFSLKLRGAPKSEIDTRVNRAADILGLGPYLERFPRQLSSASPWAALSCAIRRCFYSTSRCRTSTPSCACRCAPRSKNCISG